MKSTKIFLTLLFILSSALVFAMMPPHINNAQNLSEDHILQGDTIILQGYSLGYADLKEIIVTDQQTKTNLTYTTNLKCQSEGHGTMPGAIQEKCTLQVTMPDLQKGKKYMMRFLEWEVEFVVQ